LRKSSLQSLAIPGDGNCLFTAITFQLSIVQAKMTSKYQDLLKVKGVLGTDSIQAMAHTFRLGVIGEMEQNKVRYLPFLKNCSQYSKSGEFAGDFGDLLPTACTNYIGAIIVLFSSNAFLECQTIVPQDVILTEVPIQLACSSYGPRHYDSTVPISIENNRVIMTSIEDTHCIEMVDTTYKCRCGANPIKLLSCKNDFCKTN
jgi:hypothetical protein